MMQHDVSKDYQYEYELAIRSIDFNQKTIVLETNTILPFSFLYKHLGTQTSVRMDAFLKEAKINKVSCSYCTQLNRFKSKDAQHEIPCVGNQSGAYTQCAICIIMRKPAKVCQLVKTEPSQRGSSSSSLVNRSASPPRQNRDRERTDEREYERYPYHSAYAKEERWPKRERDHSRSSYDLNRMEGLEGYTTQNNWSIQDDYNMGYDYDYYHHRRSSDDSKVQQLEDQITKLEERIIRQQSRLRESENQETENKRLKDRIVELETAIDRNQSLTREKEEQDGLVKHLKEQVAQLQAKVAENDASSSKNVDQEAANMKQLRSRIKELESKKAKDQSHILDLTEKVRKFQRISKPDDEQNEQIQKERIEKDAIKKKLESVSMLLKRSNERAHKAENEARSLLNELTNLRAK